ncbi:MAG: hypothetical protein VX642_01170 [Bdellovibrionota bacterium]|nr:hypothetical protein [Bdellovibrionota bacterium]
MSKIMSLVLFLTTSVSLSANTFEQFKSIFENANRSASIEDFENVNECYAVELESPIKVERYKYSFKIQKLKLGPVLGEPEYPTITFSKPLAAIEFKINEYFFDKIETSTALVYTSKSKKRNQMATFKYGYQEKNVLIFELKQSILLDEPKNSDPIYYNRIIHGQCDYKQN